jgi:cytoskeletal protein RodZ
MKLLYTINNLLDSNEHFSNDSNKKNNLMISYVLTMVIYLVLVLFLGKWIWNNVLVRLVSNVNKVKSPTDLLWLSVLFSLLFGTL